MLIVADAPDVTAEVLGRLRVELGDRLGLADPNVLAYVWVHRFPMYQWDAEDGAGTRPTTRSAASCPRTKTLLTTASGDPAQPVAGGPRGPRPRAPARPRAERLGARRRLDPDPSARAAGALVRAPGPHARGDAGQVRGGPRGVRVRRAAARRDRAGHRPLGRAAANQTNIREVMAFPKTQSGTDLMLDAPSPPEPGQYEELGLRFVGGRRPRQRPERAVTYEGGTAEPHRRDRPAATVAALLGALASHSRASFISTPTVSPSTVTCLPGDLRAAAPHPGGHGAASLRAASSRGDRLAAIAGDLLRRRPMSWHHAIEAVGAGLATVLGNLRFSSSASSPGAPRGAAATRNPARIRGAVSGSS